MNSREKSNDWLDSIKCHFKRYPELYGVIIWTISPVFVFRKDTYRKLLKYIRPGNNKTILNIGSGPFKLEDDIINIDIAAYENVNIVADAMYLPFRTNSIDAVITIVVLEHVPEPERVVDEMHRILKPDGIIYTHVPFLQGYHASPHDYSRWTASGVVQLHRKFNTIETGVGAGPSSSLVWILTEWFSMVFSFRSVILYRFFFIIFTILLWPVKFFDLILIGNPMAQNIASTFYYLGKKVPNS
ncbi:MULTISPECIES: class I SAM-dependent methyltransferase [unclassified Methanoregula]|uniref:class I SAM-dependent methyltransferase n=1 Tax=unclassified Methanoregula TaxID=2649730 RepID=UPI0009D48754|nr:MULTISPECIES: class I SAM-dependent methyltransferase [unclassified Methanoregula]OPX65126.1 MAG: hypothetical protein A4E33_00157 [Methanoregula sp. PtaB.Bin085]OPY32038.1 MAG: hypothetical protein A4E34_02410 [Methanoregula sp. PtaU1.Bin006]